VLKAALAHVQFETIHPFLDGNGRVGRLLITLLLCSEGVLREPMLYLSLYLKQHRAVYYELLDAVRRNGDWETWIEFFADGVAETAEGAVATARRLLDTAAKDRNRISSLRREAGSAVLVHQLLQQVPVCNIPRLAKMSHLTVPTVTKALDVLARLHIVRELTGKKRDRVYGYDAYVKILTEGTQPL